MALTLSSRAPLHAAGPRFKWLQYKRNSLKKYFVTKKIPQKWHFLYSIRQPSRAGSDCYFLDIILATAALRTAGKSTDQHPDNTNWEGFI